MAGKRMKVVTIFDGQKEAKDVFAELITASEETVFPIINGRMRVKTAN